MVDARDSSEGGCLPLLCFYWVSQLGEGGSIIPDLSLNLAIRCNVPLIVV